MICYLRSANKGEEVMKIIVFNREEAQDYLLNQIDDEEVIYINIDNNVAHRTLNSKSMFGKNIETFNMYFADSLSAKDRLSTNDAINLCGFLSDRLNRYEYDYIIISCHAGESRSVAMAQSIAEEFGINEIEYHHEQKPNAWVKLCMKQAFIYVKSKKTDMKNIFDFKKLCKLLKEKKEIWIKTSYITDWYYDNLAEITQLKKILNEGFMKCSLAGKKIVLSDGFSDDYKFTYKMLKRCFLITLYS